MSQNADTSGSEVEGDTGSSFPKASTEAKGPAGGQFPDKPRAATQFLEKNTQTNLRGVDLRAILGEEGLKGQSSVSGIGSASGPSIYVSGPGSRPAKRRLGKSRRDRHKKEPPAIQEQDEPQQEDEIPTPPAPKAHSQTGSLDLEDFTFAQCMKMQDDLTPVFVNTKEGVSPSKAWYTDKLVPAAAVQLTGASEIGSRSEAEGALQPLPMKSRSSRARGSDEENTEEVSDSDVINGKQRLEGCEGARAESLRKALEAQKAKSELQKALDAKFQARAEKGWRSPTGKRRGSYWQKKDGNEDKADSMPSEKTE